MGKLRTALEEDNGKISMARLQVALSLGAFMLVFALWFGITAGLFFDLWPWSRFEGAIVAGGIGLLSVIFGAVGSYAANKWASRPPKDRVY
jgi:hypothetical protein